MITISFKIAELLTEIKSLSEYGSSMIPLDQAGALENSIIIDRDDEYLKSYLKSGCSNISQVLSGYTKDLINSAGEDVLMVGTPFEFDVTYATVANSIVFRLNMPETWSTDLAVLLGESMKNAMTNFTMYMYFRRKKMPFAVEYEEYQNSLSEIRTYIHQRTKAVKRNYNILH